MKKRISLYSLRQKRGIKQTDLANELKVKQSVLSCFENGRRQPKLDIAMRIAEYFGVHVENIVFGKSDDESIKSQKTAVQFMSKCTG